MNTEPSAEPSETRAGSETKMSAKTTRASGLGQRRRLRTLLHNLDFWAVVIAGVAMLLSQVPPISSWFQRRSLDVSFTRQGTLALTTVGTPVLMVFGTVANGGNRELVVRRLDARLVTPGGTEIPLPLCYESTPGQMVASPISVIRLSIGDSMSAMFSFNGEIPPELDVKAAPLTAKIFDLRTKPNERTAAVSQLMSIFNQNALSEEGDYQIKLVLFGDGGGELARAEGRFSLRKHHLNNARNTAKAMLDNPREAGPGMNIGGTAIPIQIHFQ